MLQHEVFRVVSLSAFLLASGLATADGAMSPQPVDVQVRLHAKHPDADPQQDPCRDAMLRAEPHSGRPATPQEIAFPKQRSVGVPPALTLRLLPGAWTLALISEQCWAAPRLVSVPDTATLDLEVVRLGTLHLRTRLPAGNTPVTPVSAKFFFAERDAEGTEGQDWNPDGVVGCVWNEAATEIGCAIPEGTLDVVLTSPGVASNYAWGVSITGGETTELPAWLPSAGASVAGWVRDDQSPDLSHVSVIIAHESSGRASSAEQQRRQTRTKRAVRPSSRGFFQVAGLSEGIYTVEGSRGNASAGPFRVTVVAGRETLLETTLTLQEPISFAVSVSPAAGPDGHGWRLELASMDRAPGSFETPEVARSDADTGNARFPRVKPGRYGLWLKDAKGASWWFDETEVTRASPSAFVALDMVEVCGILRLGDQPLVGQLHFGGERGVVRRSIKTDEKGAFTLLLPREGVWPVTVSSAEPAVKRMLQKVDIKYRSAKGCAPLTIALPDTLVRGVVLDEEHNPVHPAMVQVAPVSDGSLEPLAQVVTLGEDGVFELHGYPEGSVMLSAHVAGKSSDQELVTLNEDHEAPWVELVLREHIRVRGRIVSPRGLPVAGAKVFARGVRAVMAITNNTTSDLDGRFEMEISPRSTDIILSVMAAGYPMTTRLEHQIDAHEVVVRLAPAGGRLEFAMPRASFVLSDPTRPVLFNEAGLGVGLWILRQWAAINGAASSSETATLVLPALEPGTYTACMVRSAQALALAPGALPTRGCISTFVAPGGVERLELADRP